jgi:hypothetical protein
MDPKVIGAFLVVIVLVVLWFIMKPSSERLVPTWNVTFQDSLEDRATDYLYDKKGRTAADYALEQKILQDQRVSPNP